MIILIFGEKKAKLFRNNILLKGKKVNISLGTACAATKYANVLCTQEIGADMVTVWQL